MDGREKPCRPCMYPTWRIAHPLIFKKLFCAKCHSLVCQCKNIFSKMWKDVGISGSAKEQVSLQAKAGDDSMQQYINNCVTPFSIYRCRDMLRMLLLHAVIPCFACMFICFLALPSLPILVYSSFNMHDLDRTCIYRYWQARHVGTGRYCKIQNNGLCTCIERCESYTTWPHDKM